MQFLALGPLQVLADGDPLPLTGFNQKAVLGYLLLRPGQVVGVRELITALWGEAPPATARKMVQNSVAGLRRLLATREDPSVRLLTRSPGYVLDVPAGDIDLTRFDALARQGRGLLAAGEHDRARALLREALGLWRGAALADLEEGGLRWPELRALRHRRCAVHEDCAQAELALGNHVEVAGELDLAHTAEPARERLCAHLMLALYRCGRQSDALLAYQRTRAALVRRYGLEPGAELVELESRILRSDPTLLYAALPGRSATASTAPVPATASGQSAERGRASVVGVSLGPWADTGAQDLDGVDAAEIDQWSKAVTRAVTEVVRRHGGIVQPRLHTTWLAAFGVPLAPGGGSAPGGADAVHSGDAPTRAVRAAHAIRDRLRAMLAAPPAPLVFSPAALRVAVATGEVVATYRAAGDTEPVELSGRALHTSARLLSIAGPSRVWICEDTRPLLGDDVPPGALCGPDGGDTDGAGRAEPAPGDCTSGPRATAAVASRPGGDAEGPGDALRSVTVPAPRSRPGAGADIVTGRAASAGAPRREVAAHPARTDLPRVRVPSPPGGSLPPEAPAGGTEKAHDRSDRRAGARTAGGRPGSGLSPRRPGSARRAARRVRRARPGEP